MFSKTRIFISLLSSLLYYRNSLSLHLAQQVELKGVTPVDHDNQIPCFL